MYLALLSNFLLVLAFPPVGFWPFIPISAAEEEENITSQLNTRPRLEEQLRVLRGRGRRCYAQSPHFGLFRTTSPTRRRPRRRNNDIKPVLIAAATTPPPPPPQLMAPGDSCITSQRQCLSDTTEAVLPALTEAVGGC